MTARPLRVLTIGHSYAVGMNRAVAREVARDPSFEVTVAGPEHFRGDLRPVTFDPEPPETRVRTVRLRAYATGFIHVFAYDGAGLRRLVRDSDFDVIHAWEEPYIYAGYQIACAARGTRTRLLFRTAQSIVKFYPPPFAAFERASRRRMQGWVAGGELVYRAMLERGYPAERGRVISLGVDLQSFRPPTPEARAAVARELGLRGPVVGYIGRFTPAKGIDVLMRALDLVGDSVPWSLLMLGSGPLERHVLRWAKARGWADRVCVRLVRHEEMPRYVQAMDLLVAPSQTARNWREQFGRMLVEAFATGVAVIGSDSGEIPFVIGDAGIVVPESDAAGYARAIELLLRDPGARAEYAARGLARARAYSTEETARRYREFYRELAEEGAA